MVPEDASSIVVSNTVQIPIPGGGDLVIRVSHCGINHLDLIQADRGKNYKLPIGAPETLGLEVAGVILTVGEKCTRGFRVGDNVIALLSGGGYAEFAAVDERCVFPALPHLSGAENAAIPESFLTAYGLLFFTAQILPGANILVHAGSSTVGQALIQIAVRAGARVVATTRSPKKVEILIARGASEVVVVNNVEGRFARKALTCGGSGHTLVEEEMPFHAVFCPVGGLYLQDNIDCLGKDGKLVLYALLDNKVGERTEDWGLAEFGCAQLMQVSQSRSQGQV